MLHGTWGFQWLWLGFKSTEKRRFAFMSSISYTSFFTFGHPSSWPCACIWKLLKWQSVTQQCSWCMYTCTMYMDSYCCDHLLAVLYFRLQYIYCFNIHLASWKVSWEILHFISPFLHFIELFAISLCTIISLEKKCKVMPLKMDHYS